MNVSVIKQYNLVLAKCTNVLASSTWYWAVILFAIWKVISGEVESNVNVSVTSSIIWQWSKGGDSPDQLSAIRHLSQLYARSAPQ